MCALVARIVRPHASSSGRVCIGTRRTAVSVLPAFRVLDSYLGFTAMESAEKVEETGAPGPSEPSFEPSSSHVLQMFLHGTSKSPLIQFNALEHVLRALAIQVNDHDDSIEQLKESGAQLAIRCDENLATMTKEFQTLNQRMATIESSFASIKEEMATEVRTLVAEAHKEDALVLEKKLSEFNERIESSLSGMEEFKAAKTETEQRLLAVEESCKADATKLQELLTRTDSNEKCVMNVSTQMETVQTDVSGMDTKLEGLLAQLENIATRPGAPDRLTSRLQKGNDKLTTLAQQREKLTGVIKSSREKLDVLSTEVLEDPCAANWEGLERVLTGTMEVSAVLRDVVSPNLTYYGAKLGQLELFLKDLEADVTRTTEATPDTAAEAASKQINTMKAQLIAENECKTELCTLSELVSKLLGDTYVERAKRAREFTKPVVTQTSGQQGIPPSTTASQPKEKPPKPKERGLPASRVASKKALEDTQKKIAATTAKLSKAIKETQGSVENFEHVTARLEQRIEDILRSVESNKNGLVTGRNDVTDLTGMVLQLQRELDETKEAIPEPTKPYDDSKILEQLDHHANELVGLLQGVTELKDSEGRFDSEIKAVFHEHSEKLAHLLATKADSRSVEQALKGKAPMSLERQVQEFVHRVVSKQELITKNTIKQSRADRAVLEARMIKLITRSLLRLKQQQQQLQKILGPVSGPALMYKCLTCDRPDSNALFTNGNKYAIEPQQPAATPGLVDFEDPALQARRNTHTQSPYRTVGAGFRVMTPVKNKGAPIVTRPQTAPHVHVHK